MTFIKLFTVSLVLLSSQVFASELCFNSAKAKDYAEMNVPAEICISGVSVELNFFRDSIVTTKLTTEVGNFTSKAKVLRGKQVEPNKYLVAYRLYDVVEREESCGEMKNFQLNVVLLVDIAKNTIIIKGFDGVMKETLDACHDPTKSSDLGYKLL